MATRRCVLSMCTCGATESDCIRGPCVRDVAGTLDANHPVCYAFTKQATQEAAALLLGGVPEIRRQWEAEAGDDSRGVRLFATVI